MEYMQDLEYVLVWESELPSEVGSSAESEPVESAKSRRDKRQKGDLRWVSVPIRLDSSVISEP